MSPLPRQREGSAYQLTLSADGRVLDVQRAPAGPGPRRYAAEGATVYYSARHVPLHVCYDRPRDTHPDDRQFCHRKGHRSP